MQLEAIYWRRQKLLEQRVTALEAERATPIPIDDLFEKDTPPPAATGTLSVTLGRLKPCFRLLHTCWEIVSALFEFAPYLATAAGAVWFGVVLPLLRFLGLLLRALGIG